MCLACSEHRTMKAGDACKSQGACSVPRHVQRSNLYTDQQNGVSHPLSTHTIRVNYLDLFHGFIDAGSGIHSLRWTFLGAELRGIARLTNIARWRRRKKGGKTPLADIAQPAWLREKAQKTKREWHHFPPSQANLLLAIVCAATVHVWERDLPYHCTSLIARTIGSILWAHMLICWWSWTPDLVHLQP